MSSQKPTPAHGKFIVFEGLDGSGKTTMAGLFAEYLAEHCGVMVARTREPGGTPFGEQCRTLLFSNPQLSAQTQALLVNAARREHVERMIMPCLKNGTTVVCDRWTLSTMVYQAAMKPTSDLELLCDIGTAGLHPEILFILATDYDVFKARTEGRGDKNFLDDKTQALFESQLQQYLKYHASGLHATVWIDASGDKEQVLHDIVTAYQRYVSNPRQVKSIPA